MDFTRLVAVSYDDPDRPGKKIIRVYYQVGSQIRESYYDDENGWYVRGGDVVATNAKPRSPITATNLSQGKKTSVFYLDAGNRLCRRVRTTAKAGDKGDWVDGPITQPGFTISPASQLTAVRTDKEQQNIRVFYQSTDNKLRGIVSKKDNGVWSPSDLELSGALPGTSLCAIAGGSEVRLFYQSDVKTIKEYYSNPNTDWRASRVKTWSADVKAPISAVAWNYGSSQFQIRAFTLQSNTLVELVYDEDEGGWNENSVSTNEIVVKGTNPDQTSAVAATGLDENGKLTVFYQPSKQVIAQYDSVSKRLPLGIPTARD